MSRASNLSAHNLLTASPVRIYDGFNKVKRVRIRILVAESDGLPRLIALTDTQDGHLVLVHKYYDYNKDIVIQAP